jgi:hypothetical protein
MHDSGADRTGAAWRGSLDPEQLAVPQNLWVGAFAPVN